MMEIRDAFVSILALLSITYGFIFLDIIIESIREKFNKKDKEIIGNIIAFILSLSVQIFVLVEAYSLDLIALSKLIPLSYIFIISLHLMKTKTSKIHENKISYAIGFVLSMILTLTRFLN